MWRPIIELQSNVELKGVNIAIKILKMLELIKNATVTTYRIVVCCVEKSFVGNSKRKDTLNHTQGQYKYQVV